jgi:hypothetical protein
MIITRYQAGIYLLFPGVVTISVVKNRKQLIGLAIMLLSGLVAVLPQLFAWKALYGEWIVYTYHGESLNWQNPKIWKVLFSPLHGWFYTHPVMLIGTAGFIYFLVKKKNMHLYFLGIVLFLVVYVNASWHNWWFGGSFGHRAFEGCTLFIMIGLAQIFTIVRKSKVMAISTITVLLFLILWNLNLLYLLRYKGQTGLRMNQPITYKMIVEKSVKFYIWRFGEKKDPGD